MSDERYTGTDIDRLAELDHDTLRTRAACAMGDALEKKAAGGDRHNAGKPPLWLLPWSALAPRIPEDRHNAAHAMWHWCRREQVDLSLAAQTQGVLEGASYILEFGAVKYTPYNWEKGLSFIETVSSGLRHAVAEGELDDDSGLSHRNHLRCNLIFLAHFASDPGKYAKFDDRPK